ncbi:hypothetical protein CC77DRAFT_621000 [Alternaria alternata]|uniref:Uncharacterized protein n=1 Tax=Alternaria alternata TaxID=5599 RepID=A0A177DY76_ALTAL|nr:hypothetical protein CC77DRAFT_621000 [Alternaria alternata]OAG23729.1 hypothetical protein CC77DRAFT_621000 [Alternaria alternata]
MSPALLLDLSVDAICAALHHTCGLRSYHSSMPSLAPTHAHRDTIPFGHNESASHKPTEYSWNLHRCSKAPFWSIKLDTLAILGPIWSSCVTSRPTWPAGYVPPSAIERL